MQVQLDNLKKFILKQKEIFDLKLAEYGCEGMISWHDPQWFFGEKGAGWFRQGGAGSLNFSSTYKMKGLESLEINCQYIEFMKAVIISEIFTKNISLSGIALGKRLNVLKRWYHELFILTSQTSPVYLTADIVYSAMKRHYDNSSSKSNVSDYCDIAVLLARILRTQNFTLTNIECINKYPCRNPTHNTKKRKLAEMTGEHTDDEKLITIRTFMHIVEMIYLAKTDAEKVFLNFMMLLIVTGFRFREAQCLTIDALVKREIVDLDKMEHARSNGLPIYHLGIRYLGAKKAGWRIHWLAPSTIPLVESIFNAVKELTADSRKRLNDYRKSNFMNYLPPPLLDLNRDLIEVSELENIIFQGSGGIRGNGGFRRSMISSFKNHGIGMQPVHIEEINKVDKRFFFTKQQVNQFIKSRYEKLKAFQVGDECSMMIKESGQSHKFLYEDLLFIAPIGSFALNKDLIILSNPVPVDSANILAWLGAEPNRKSFFEMLGMTEDDGSRISMGTHFPRHNINTFLAIAEVTDHLQAMLMGRMDITQNIHYQHVAESQSFRAASLSAMMLEDRSDKSQTGIDHQLSIYRRENTSVQAPDLNHSNSFLKETGMMLIDPTVNIETNFKTNLQTYGQTNKEVANYITSTISDSFLPELKAAHAALIASQKDKEASELISRHALLYPLELGCCTRDVGRWGCPFAMKCQSGLPCGYFTLSGHPKEIFIIRKQIAQREIDIKKLEVLIDEDPGYTSALNEAKESLLILEGFQKNTFISLRDKKFISILSQNEANPLLPIFKRIETQMAIGKTPNTLADLFFIEHKRKKAQQARMDTNNG